VTLPVRASRFFIEVSSVGEHIYIPIEDPGADEILLAETSELAMT
jgi:DNA-binding sugar fermentation-stimulating protein